MSHNVLLKGVRIADLNVLSQAIDEIVRENNSSIRLVKEPCDIRGYARRKARVDAAIMCPNDRYDIGFMKQADGSYAPFFESGFRATGIAAETSAGPVGETCDYQAGLLGKLIQRYSVCMAEKNAIGQGFMTRRIGADKGMIQLEVISR